MDTLFPFGFPPPTAFYLTLYILTLVLHALFMHYVLAGSACLAAAAIFGRDGRAASLANPLADTLRDWLPFMLSSAITAGVAPLLFVQVLYPQQFYSANLLLFYRWMLILPALIAGFYLLYLQKSKLVAAWPLAGRLAVGGGALACFAFTALSWTENHLLSLDAAVWPRQYAEGWPHYASRETAPRLALWFAACFPTLALILAWQRWYAQASLGNEDRAPGVRRCAALAIVGLISSLTLAAILYFVLDGKFQQAVTGRMAGPYLFAAILGCGLQLGAWYAQYQRPRFSRNCLLVASLGLTIALIAGAVVRESRRLAALDLTTLYPAHENAFQSRGFWLFLFFLVLNTLLITACFLIVRRGVRAAKENLDTENTENTENAE